MSGVLRDYQVVDLSFYMQEPRCLNTSDPGTGKTPSVCTYASYQWFELKNRVVWTQPNGLLKKNRDEMLEFSDFKPEDVVIVTGDRNKRLKLMKSDAKVFLMGFRTFSDHWQDILEFHPDIDCLLVDELHMGYGGHTSQRTQNLYAAMEKIKYFVGMTGTIINGRLSSIYPSMQIIDPELYPGGYEGFMYQHAIEDDYGRVVAWRDTKKIAGFLGNYAIRHSFEEVYGPEAKVIIHEKVDMDPAQRAAYEEFEAAALLELEETWLDGSANQAVFTIRCRQIMEHPQTLGAPLDQIKMTGKEERLLVHLENCKQSGKPMIVFGALVPQLERIAEIAKGVGLRVGLIHGGVSTTKRFEIDEKFRAGEIDLVVASPSTTAVGYNWGHVDTIVFVSLDYMDASFRQGYRRAIRGVREKALLIYILQYEDCEVEDRIFDIVQRKADMAHEVDNTVQQIDIRPKKKKVSKELPPLPRSMSDIL